MFRALRYMPPLQMQAADLLLRQGNAKVEKALTDWKNNLVQMNRTFDPNLPTEKQTVWMRFYKPRTGQEWFVTALDENKLYCLYYCGEFYRRIYDPQVLRMEPGIVLDIYFQPQTFSELMKTHKNCEDCRKRRIDFVKLMR